VATGLTVFDPKVLYDQHAARWVVLAVAFRQAPNVKTSFLQGIGGMFGGFGSLIWTTEPPH